MKKIFLALMIIFLSVCILVFISIFPKGKSSNEKTMYYKQIEQICADNGYKIKNQAENSFGNSSYSNNMFIITLADSGYDLQVIINEPPVGNQTISLSVYKEIYSTKEACYKLDEHYGLFVDLINAFCEEDISEEMIHEFFTDSSNITMENEYHSEWNQFYLIRKSGDLNSHCGMLYIMEACPDKYDLSDYRYVEGDCIIEELCIGTYDMYLKNM